MNSTSLNRTIVQSRIQKNERYLDIKESLDNLSESETDALYRSVLKSKSTAKCSYTKTTRRNLKREAYALLEEELCVI